MGRTAFLNIVKRKGVTAPVSPNSGGAETSADPQPSLKESCQDSMEHTKRCKPDGAAPKSPCEDGGGLQLHLKSFYFLINLSNVYVKITILLMSVKYVRDKRELQLLIMLFIQLYNFVFVPL